jgi:hypothetical protein
MASVVEICNVALIRCGADVITSLSQDTKGAKLCNVMYEPTRDALLRSHPWNFANRRVQLAASATEPAFEFEYQFPLPSDYLKMQRVYEDYYGHRIESMNDGTKVLLSHSDEVFIEYTANITDPNLMDPLFRSALSLALATAICPALTENAKMTEGLSAQAADMLAMARTADAQEGTPRDPDTSLYEMARI